MTRDWKTVGDVMTRTVVAAGRDTAFHELLEMLRQWKISGVPVLNEEGRVVGVVSEADVLREADLDPRHAPGMTARELMTAPAVTVRADSPTPLAARLMTHHGLKRLPVVDEERRLVGVVSRSDLLKVHLRADEDIAAQVRFELVALLHPGPAGQVEVRAQEGRVTFTGTLPDLADLPVLERLVRAVPGVVDVEVRLVHAA
jgi:CBS domain-containing protein